ncbi:hypothetical protein D3C76_1742330 [compost metagenome]
MSLGGDEGDLLGELIADEWEFIRSKRVLAQVLDAAEVGGWALVQRYLKRLGYLDRPPNEFPGRNGKHAGRQGCNPADQLTTVIYRGDHHG